MICTKVFGLCIAIAMVISCECFAQDCSGARRTPLRNLVAARPIRTATQNVFQKITVSSRSQSCAGSVQASCSSSMQSSYAGSAHSVIVVSAPVAQLVSSDYAIAKQKSDLQAFSGSMRHVGGSFGTGQYEGVGFSTVSAKDATERACYYGQRPLVASAVSRGANGWYATNLYN